MAETVPFPIEVRDRAGKGAARATRRAGRVPGVIYGNKQDPILISVDPKALQAQVRQPGFFSRIFELETGKGTERVLCRDLQIDPVSDKPVHVDFMRFSERTRLVFSVDVVFENEEESPGLKRGGVLNIVRHQVEVICRPDRVPINLTFDLTGKDIGDSLHISEVDLPEGVQPEITDRDFTIATIAAPTVVAEEQAEEQAEAEAEALAEEGELLEGEEGEAAEGEEGEAKEGEEGKEGESKEEGEESKDEGGDKD